MSDHTIPQVVPCPKTNRFIDITNQTFDRLTVIGYVGSSNGRAVWLCECVCGRHIVAVGKDLRVGRTVSCGCKKSERSRAWGLTHTRHGMTDTPEWRAWKGMLERCYLESCHSYPHYGGRGIVVCERWRNSFENFFEDIGRRPTTKHSLDRIDNDGNYEPSNCRWATASQQALNTRRTVMITYNGVTRPLIEWAKDFGLHSETLRRRILKYKWSVERALTTPVIQ